MVETGEAVGNPTVRLCEIKHNAGSCGLNLSKSKWDPYPWVSTVEADSPASMAGVLPGDCLLEVNGEDMLGLRMAEVAARVRARGDRATVMLWNAGVDPTCSPENLCCGPMPTNLQRLTTCVSSILEALECPICLDTIPPPAHQCANGHLICVCCRARTERCPVCRMRFFRGRSLLADQVFDSLVDAFDLRHANEGERSKLLIQRAYGSKKKQKKQKPEIKINFISPTNKFLTRIMGSGKSSSVENLSPRHNNTTAPQVEDYSSGLKIKSLSSSEIFSADLQVMSRSSSVLSNRPGSGLLEVSDSLGPRPASYHGSADDLRSRIIDDFGLDVGACPAEVCSCPLAPACKAVVSPTTLKNHLQLHENPIIKFWRPNVTVNLGWLQEALIVLKCFGTSFFIRAIPTEMVWVWTVAENSIEYSASVRVQDCTHHCNVISLSDLNEDSLSSNGIPLVNIIDMNIEIEVAISKN